MAASKLGVSVKLAHETLKQMVARGLLHVKKEHARRWDYFLTPQGIAEKTRLTCEFLDFSMQFYREARRRSAQLCRDLHEVGTSHIAFLGAGEMAEIVYLGVVEWKLQLSEVFDDDRTGRDFMGIRVQPVAHISSARTEAIIICQYDSKHPMTERFLPPGVSESDRMHWVF